MLTLKSPFAQNKVAFVDLNKYSGKWYVIASIPTGIDRSWNFVTETYTINKKGNVDIYTTYIKQNKTKQHSFRSKGFPQQGTNNFKWKVQLLWPFMADYLIEELADDYSFVVVGHPKKKYLYIMSRANLMDIELYLEIVERCKEKGYNVSRIRKMRQ